ncbi:hypothetical protein [Spiroplasma endosymbiont of Virgichneumon dumeticola]|uniref:hypothetical protein n=1 Tax=Spiroplasma endosymbiont of Virgichneumon dumeticola TaxID=3139323 RepID=UPI0035C8B101
MQTKIEDNITRQSIENEKDTLLGFCDLSDKEFKWKIQLLPNIMQLELGIFSQKAVLGIIQYIRYYKYYSYDTSHAIGNLSDGTPTKNTFIVDSNGNLTIDSSLKLTEADKSMLNNIQAEMNSHKKITSVKDFYNPYSKSVYNDSFFSGDNSNWKYLQMGGVENHIDISSQQLANKVEHSNSLSETLGLYYIAKAERIPGGIDSTTANSLGKYFRLFSLYVLFLNFIT